MKPTDLLWTIFCSLCVLCATAVIIVWTVTETKENLARYKAEYEEDEESL